MEKNAEVAEVKVYGVFKHPGVLSLQHPINELIEGNCITIEDHLYIISSVISESHHGYTINVNFQRKADPN